MARWSREDEQNMQKILAVTDESTTEWIEKKTKELMTLMMYYKCAMLEVETKFNVLNEEYSLVYERNPISTIKTRLKSPQSISKKMQKKGVPITPDTIEETLNDIAGVRVVCSFPEDVYMLAESFLKQDDIILIEKKDYIANPKPNGYRSLHMIIAIPVFLAREKHLIKVEIQIRTIAMDFWASLEHEIRYKKPIEFTEEMAEKLYECAEMSSVLDEKMDALRKSVMKISDKNELNTNTNQED